MWALFSYPNACHFLVFLGMMGAFWGFTGTTVGAQVGTRDWTGVFRCFFLFCAILFLGGTFQQTKVGSR